MRKNIKRAISGVAGMTMAVSAQVAAAEAVAKAIGGLTSEEGAIGKLTGTVNSFINTYNEREKSAKEDSIRAFVTEEYLKEFPQYKDSFKAFFCHTSNGVDFL